MTALSTDPWVGKDWEQVEIPRDGMGRPMVMLADGSKRVAYRRTTTFVGALEDRYNLELWKLRRACWGMGQRPDLTLKACSAHVDDKLTLDEVSKDAMEYAESSRSATVGTALHKLCERRDRGEPLGNIPEPYEADIAAYDKAMKRFGIEHREIETFRVHDNWRIAGTADRISALDGENYIADIKGLALDTPLPTPTGWTTMGAVKNGDEVLGPDGYPCTVTMKSPVKHIGTYVVRFDDGSQVVCDSEHIWSTTTAADRRNRKAASPRGMNELIDTFTYQGQRQHCIPVSDPLQLPTADLPIEPYLLGCWLGDGQHSRNVISKQDDLFDEIATAGHHLGKRQVDRRTGCVARTIIGLMPALRKANLLGHKHIPVQYLRASIEQRIALLQGLMDTDGSWNTARSRAVFTNTNKELAHNVFELLATLGQRPHLAEIQRSGFGKTVTAYDIEFTPVGVLPLPFRLPHKHTTVARRRLITSIEPGPDVPTACIGVDSHNHMYLCGEAMIPTHNTGDIDRVHKILMQLAMYRMSTPYDIATDTRGVDRWQISQARGIVIHLPAGEGVCDLHFIDLEKGRAGLQICYKVFDFRGGKRKEMIWPISDQIEMFAPPIQADFDARVHEAACIDELRTIYLEAVEKGFDTKGFVARVKVKKADLMQFEVGAGVI